MVLAVGKSEIAQKRKMLRTVYDKVADNTVTWIMQCSGEGGEMKGNGKITYSENSLKDKIEMTMPQTNMKMTSHISGHRIGDCK